MKIIGKIYESFLKNRERSAISFENKKISYGELESKISALANFLIYYGIKKGDVVGIAMENVPEYIISVYAVQKIGAAAVAINPFYSEREINHIIKDSKMSLFLGSDDTSPFISKIAYKNKIGHYSININSRLFKEFIIPEEVLSEKTGKIENDETALIMYTNGSNGNYMGACLSQQALLAAAEASIELTQFRADEVLLSALPLYHSFAWTACINVTLLSGGTIILHRQFKPEQFYETLKTEKIDYLPIVPNMLKVLLVKYGNSGLDLSGIKAVIPGGAPSGKEFLEKFAQVFRANIYEGFGTTELCGPVISNPVNEMKTKLGSVGKPLKNVEIKIIDNNGNELRSGREGELLIRGKQIMSGYLNNTNATHEFLKDGWFHTGDVAMADEDGYVYITGRTRNMILIGGFNVYPKEVEKVIMSHPLVAACHVYKEVSAEFSEIVAAKIKIKENIEANIEEIKKFLRESLAAYKIPKKIEWSSTN